MSVSQAACLLHGHTARAAKRHIGPAPGSESEPSRHTTCARARPAATYTHVRPLPCSRTAPARLCQFLRFGLTCRPAASFTSFERLGSLGCQCLRSKDTNSSRCRSLSMWSRLARFPPAETQSTPGQLCRASCPPVTWLCRQQCERLTDIALHRASHWLTTRAPRHAHML